MAQKCVNFAAIHIHIQIINSQVFPVRFRQVSYAEHVTYSDLLSMLLHINHLKVLSFVCLGAHILIVVFVGNASWVTLS